MSTDTPTDIAFEAIPAELKERSQWVLYKAPGPGKKIPYQTNGEEAKANEPETWADYEAVVERFSISSTFAGIGYEFSADDPYCGIDLDGCRDPHTGSVMPWAEYWITRFDTYTEISPSQTGFKLICKGTNTKGSGGNKKIGVEHITDKEPGVEIYDRGRFFVLTGWHLASTPTSIEPRQEAIDEFVAKYFPKQKSSGSSSSEPSRLDLVERCWKYVQKCDDAISGNNGHNKTFHAACECFRFGLTDSEAMEVLRRYNSLKTGGEEWSDRELQHKLDSAREHVTAAGEFGERLQHDRNHSSQYKHNGHNAQASSEPDNPQAERPRISALTLRQLVTTYPTLRPPVIHGLLRQGETMNVIAPPKTGKSWLTNDLALSVATGKPWLGLFEVEQGEVLILDNELHHETSAHRIPIVADARNTQLAKYADVIHIVNLRGHLLSIPMFGSVLDQFEPGRLKLIVLDAFYRAIPPGTDENANGDVANLYNLIDHFAMTRDCSFVLIHHSTKGSQSGKAVTDVGAGAGSQSRATDTHLVLRPHKEPNCVVLDAAVRSWKPIEPCVLRWSFPLWNPADDLDPADLKPDRPARAKREAAETPAKDEWTRERFVAEIVGTDGPTRGTIMATAADHGLSEYKAKQWLGQCEAKGLVYRWTFGRHEQHQFHLKPQPVLDTPQSRGEVQ